MQLADWRSTDEIDLLIGSNFYWSVVTGKTKTGKNNETVGVETKFGWVLNRPVTSFEASTNSTFENEYSHVLFLNTDQSVRNENINFNVNRFWDLETIDICEKEDWNLHDFQDSIYFNKKADVKPGCFLKNRTKLCQIITLFVKN